MMKWDEHAKGEYAKNDIIKRENWWMELEQTLSLNYK